MLNYDKFHYKKGRVITIYNWIDEHIQKAASPYDPNGSKILTAGRFSKEKGMDLLVDTAAALAKKTTVLSGKYMAMAICLRKLHKESKKRGLKIMSI